MFGIRRYQFEACMKLEEEEEGRRRLRTSPAKIGVFIFCNIFQKTINTHFWYKQIQYQIQVHKQVVLWHNSENLVFQTPQACHDCPLGWQNNKLKSLIQLLKSLRIAGTQYNCNYYLGLGIKAYPTLAFPRLMLIFLILTN